MKIPVTIEVEAPDGATHYTGELTDDPQWWKYSENSTGTFKGWCYWSPSRNGWYIHGKHAPRWAKEIPADRPAPVTEEMKEAGFHVVEYSEAGAVLSLDQVGEIVEAALRAKEIPKP